jgi:hypothetical protein
MKEIAVIVNNLAVTQNNFYMIKRFNEMVKDPKRSVSCFMLQPSPPVIKPMFSCRNVRIAFGVSYWLRQVSLFVGL